MGKLQYIEPYMRGQIVGYVDRPKLCCSSGGEWYAVNTKPRQEGLARGEIALIGFAVYLPIIMMRENGGRKKPRMVERPMFGSYLFVCCQSNAELWGRIRAARGVHRLLGDKEHPMPIAEGAIEAIRLHEAEAAQAQPRRKSGIIWHFSAEESVRIKSGPFMGFYARLKSAVDKHDRVRALLQMFGRDSLVELSAHEIEASEH